MSCKHSILIGLLLTGFLATPVLAYDGAWAGVFAFQKRMAEQGNPQSQYKLGEMYEEGLGVEQDFEAARNWYGKAAEQGYKPAEIKMQEGISREKWEARQQTKSAADKAREAEEREQARQEAEAKARLEAEAKARQDAAAKEKARQEALAREKSRKEAAAREKARQEALAREQARQEAAAREKARQEAAAREQARREAEARAKSEALAAERQAEQTAATEARAEPEPVEDDKSFKSNPCDTPAARFMSTCQ